MLRPMRPNPLIPTLTAISNSLYEPRLGAWCRPKQLILVNAFEDGQTR
jgi:hypothetical protein